MDVTGTMVSFNGKLEKHYSDAARWCGVSISNTEVDKISHSFKTAYKETCVQHPCFGNSIMSTKDWWRVCVLKSFEYAGVNLTPDQKENVFRRIYSLFGSHATYSAFPDAKPFLKWARRRNLVCGVLSNADERYGDSILPMLGLEEELNFLCFSKELGVEKPNVNVFEKTRKAAELWTTARAEGKWGPHAAPLLPSEILHIGNDFEKDFIGARNAGFHAVLLDRFDEEGDAERWIEGGAPVFKDLIDVVEFLARKGFQLG